MKSSRARRAAGALVLLALICSVAEAGAIRKLTIDPNASVVRLFDGLEEGSLKARVVPQSQFSADVFIANTTDAPLTVAVPEAVAAVHVLKQFGDGNLGDGSIFGNDTLGQGTQGAGQGQTIGGPMQTQGAQGTQGFPQFPGGNQFPGNNFFSIPPEKTVQLKLATVCLDHGRPDPMPAMRYALKPLEEVVSDPATAEILRQYQGQKSERMALQAAVWHLQGDMKWDELAAKRAKSTVERPYFTRAQLERGRELTERARKVAASKEARPKAEPAVTASVSRRR